eukprot:355061-Chlamydomonas_euryale.AAC.2
MDRIASTLLGLNRCTWTSSIASIQLGLNRCTWTHTRAACACCRAREGRLVGFTFEPPVEPPPPGLRRLRLPCWNCSS